MNDCPDSSGVRMDRWSNFYSWWYDWEDIDMMGIEKTCCVRKRDYLRQQTINYTSNFSDRLKMTDRKCSSLSSPH